ncbi:MAG: prephenate dehydratase domain-containing protein, partial [Eubacteriales bacterium]|nr:prephenate dehydratase domain-containing protein [Eubacteriales bacterium]
MKDILDARNEINEIDKQMAQLFQKRMEAVKDVAVYKKDNGLSVRDLSREAEVAKRNSKFVTDESLKPYYVDFIRNTIDVSCKYQESLLRNMTVAYCGVEGAFAHIAAKKMFPTATYKPCATFSEAYEGVEKGDYDCAVLPLENSYAGEVGEVMDLTFSGDLHINQVIEVPITHNL